MTGSLRVQVEGAPDAPGGGMQRVPWRDYAPQAGDTFLLADSDSMPGSLDDVFDEAVGGAEGGYMPSEVWVYRGLDDPSLASVRLRMLDRFSEQLFGSLCEAIYEELGSVDGPDRADEALEGERNGIMLDLNNAVDAALGVYSKHRTWPVFVLEVDAVFWAGGWEVVSAALFEAEREEVKAREGVSHD